MSFIVKLSRAQLWSIPPRRFFLLFACIFFSTYFIVVVAISVLDAVNVECVCVCGCVLHSTEHAYNSTMACLRNDCRDTTNIISYYVLSIRFMYSKPLLVRQIFFIVGGSVTKLWRFAHVRQLFGLTILLGFLAVLLFIFLATDRHLLT